MLTSCQIKINVDSTLQPMSPLGEPATWVTSPMLYTYAADTTHMYQAMIITKKAKNGTQNRFA